MSIETLFAMAEGLVNSGQAETAGEMARQLYEQKAAEIRPFVAVIRPLVEAAGGDLGTVIATLAGGINAMGENPALLAEVKRLQANRARSRMAGLNAYQEAGFTRKEALTLVLIDATNAKALGQQVGQSLGSAGAKAKKN